MNEFIELQISEEDFSYLTEEGAIKSEPEELVTGNENAGLNRVRHWLMERDCAILTAWRGDDENKVPYAENELNNQKLQKTLRRFRYGVIQVRGCYTHKSGELVSEKSFLTVNLEDSSQHFYDVVRRQSEIYQQESFLYKEAGIDKRACLVYTRGDNNGSREDLGTLKIDCTSAENFSQVGNARVSFHGKSE